jgi:transcriptional regulator with XRE-family HTH domain
MPKKKIDIRDILALNLKKYRKKCGLTQEKLAESAGISAHYLAMVEVSRKFPTPEMLDKLAQALGIETHELFTVAPSASNELELLRNEIINEVKTLNEILTDNSKEIKAIKQILEKEKKNQKK